MGIFLSEPVEACEEDKPEEVATPCDADIVSPFATFGMDAASSPVPVAARNERRSMLDDLRELFMRSPRRCWCIRRAALYDAFCRGKLSDSHRFEGSEGRN